MFIGQLGHAGNIKSNNEIGTIDSLGPYFRVSFELIIHSHVDYVDSNILAFTRVGGNGGTISFM